MREGGSVAQSPHYLEAYLSPSGAQPIRVKYSR